MKAIIAIIPLVNWGNGTIMIGVFALVCIILSIVVYSMVSGGKKNDKEENK